MFNKTLLNNIATELKKNRKSIAVAESVTGGLLQASFTNADDASLFFQGGITVYNVGQKCRHLLVEPLHAIECNSVSEKIAQDMSKNVCDLFTSDYGLGVTGYAAKMPEKNINNLFVYYAIAKDQKVLESGKINTDKEQGLPAQLDYVDAILKKLLHVLEDV